MSYNIRYETYLNRRLADMVDDIDQPASEFIRESIRRELQRREATDELEKSENE